MVAGVFPSPPFSAFHFLSTTKDNNCLAVPPPQPNPSPSRVHTDCHARVCSVLGCRDIGGFVAPKPSRTTKKNTFIFPSLLTAVCVFFHSHSISTFFGYEVTSTSRLNGRGGHFWGLFLQCLRVTRASDPPSSCSVLTKALSYCFNCAI